MCLMWVKIDKFNNEFVFIYKFNLTFVPTITTLFAIHDSTMV